MKASPACPQLSGQRLSRRPPYLILTVQFLIRNVGRKVCVQQCTEGQTIIPAAAEVCNVNILKGKKNGISNTCCDLSGEGMSQMVPDPQAWAGWALLEKHNTRLGSGAHPGPSWLPLPP